MREGQRSFSGMTGLCYSRTKPPMGQSRWGLYVLGRGEVGGLVEGRGGGCKRQMV